MLIALYVGPDQMMPVASILATLMGFIMIFWNKVVSTLRRLTGVFRRSAGGVPQPPAADTSSKQPPKQA